MKKVMLIIVCVMMFVVAITATGCSKEQAVKAVSDSPSPLVDRYVIQAQVEKNGSSQDQTFEPNEIDQLNIANSCTENEPQITADLLSMLDSGRYNVERVFTSFDGYGCLESATVIYTDDGGTLGKNVRLKIVKGDYLGDELSLKNELSIKAKIEQAQTDLARKNPEVRKIVRSKTDGDHLVAAMVYYNET